MNKLDFFKKLGNTSRFIVIGFGVIMLCFIVACSFTPASNRQDHRHRCKDGIGVLCDYEGSVTHFTGKRGIEEYHTVTKTPDGYIAKLGARTWRLDSSGTRTAEKSGHTGWEWKLIEEVY